MTDDERKARRLASAKKYRDANAEKVKAAQKKWREEHPDRAKAASDKWRQQNPERVKLTRTKYRDDNREHIRAVHRAWCANNREKLAAKTRAWQKANLDKARERNYRRRARLKGAPVIRFTAADWRRIREEHGYACFYCGAVGVPLDREHKTPLSRGGSHTPENIVPACRPCNVKKGTLTDQEFAAR